MHMHVGTLFRRLFKICNNYDKYNTNYVYANVINIIETFQFYPVSGFSSGHKSTFGHEVLNVIVHASCGVCQSPVNLGIFKVFSQTDRQIKIQLNVEHPWELTFALTHRSLATFLCDIGNQHNPNCDTTKHGVPSGAILLLK